MPKNGQITRKDIVSDETLNWGADYAKTVKKAIKANKKNQKSTKKTVTLHLSSEIEALKKTNAILVKRDRALRERFAYMLWLQFTDEFNCDETATIKELDRLDSCYDSDQKIRIEKPDIKLFYWNRNWFVNKHLDAFLSQFS